MALDSYAVQELIRLFNRQPRLLNTILAGDDSILPSLATAADVKKPKQADFDEIRNIAKALGGTDNGGAGLGSLDNMNKKYGGYFDAVSGNATKGLTSVLKTDPKTMAIEAGLGALGEASHAAADTVLNNYNKLAEAILAGARTSGEGARNTYGKSPQERAAEHLANEKQRKGNNIAIWANAIGNIVDKITGKVERDNVLERQAKMRPFDKELNMSGQYYDAQRKMYGY